MSKYIFLVLFFFGCVTVQQSTSLPEVATYMGITITTPAPCVNYSSNVINNNIEKSITVINSLEKEIKEIEKRSTTTDSPLLKEKQSKKREFEKLKNDWKDIGFYSTDIRNQENQSTQLIDLQEDDFFRFIGLEKGDFLGKVTDIFGNPQDKNESYVAYKVNNNLVLEFSGDYNGRIDMVRVIGQEGYKFVKDKKVSDEKYQLLGLNISKIEELFTEELAYNSSSKLYRTNYSKVEFSCPSTKNFTCQFIKVNW